MLSNKGSARFSFVITFILIFLVCGIYCFLELNKNSLGKRSSDNSYEAELKAATEKYVNVYYRDLDAGERVIVKVSTLRKLNYIKMEDCEGYSLVDKGDSIEIESFVKCKNYESSNYSKEYE